MPRRPRRTLPIRNTRRALRTKQIINPLNLNTNQIYLSPVHFYPVSGLLEGSVPIYSTPVAPLNPNTASWVEMALQGQALVMMEEREAMFVIITPELLAHLVSKGMRRVREL